MRFGKQLFLIFVYTLFTVVEPSLAKDGADRGGGGGVVIDENGELRFLDLHLGKNIIPFSQEKYQQYLTTNGRSEVSNLLNRVSSEKFFQCAIAIFEDIELKNNFRFPILSLPLKHLESFHVVLTELPLETFHSGQIDLVYENAPVRIDEVRKSPLLTETISTALQRPIAYFHHRPIPRRSDSTLLEQKINFGFLIVNRQLYNIISKNKVQSCAFQVHEALRRVSSFGQDSPILFSNPKLNFSFFKKIFSSAEVEKLTQVIISNHLRSNSQLPSDFQNVLSSFAKELVNNYPQIKSVYQSDISPDLYLHLFRSYLRDFGLNWDGTRVIEDEQRRANGFTLINLSGLKGSERTYDLNQLSY
jgi:hypothetical protein